MRDILTENLAVPDRIEDVDADWLTAALGLGTVAAVSAIPFGNGNAAIALRLEVTWASAAPPSTFVAKIAATDPNRRRALIKWRAYEVEAAFYAHLAPGLAARIPRCHWAGFDPRSGAYAVLLEDLRTMIPGDDMLGCDADAVAAVIAEVAHVHGARWADPALAGLPWFNRYPKGAAGLLGTEMARALPQFLTHCAEGLPDDIIDQITRFVERSDRYDRKGFGSPRTITHGDLRNDNILFGADRPCIIDWQTAQLGSALADVAYYVGAALAPDQRRANEEDLLRDYHQRLTAQGVTMTWDWCWREYRRHAYSLLTTMLKAALALDLGDRSRAMVRSLASRSAQQALDLESDTLLLT